MVINLEMRATGEEEQILIFWHLFLRRRDDDDGSAAVVSVSEECGGTESWLSADDDSSREKTTLLASEIPLPCVIASLLDTALACLPYLESPRMEGRCCMYLSSRKREETGTRAFGCS